MNTLLLTNGKIYTMDPIRPTATAVAIRDGKILAVGGNDLADEFDSPGVERIDLRGRCVIPGLVDSLNIRRVVTEKVDSLDLLKLERLLLSIMEEQFKYINLFGALLGFLIGFINLLALQIM